MLIHRYRWWETDFITSLEQNLNALGGQRLSGHIQCIDTISGCGNALYRMRLEPANGLLVDFPLFGADDVPLSGRRGNDVSLQWRQTRHRSWWSPASLYVDGPGNFGSSIVARI